MKINVLFLILVLFMMVSGSPGQKPSATPVSPKKPSYADLLAKVKGGDTSVDYKAFRIAFSETDDAGPYGSDRDMKKAMYAAINKKEYKDAIKAADEILKSAFVNADAHAVESIAYRELGDAEKAAFHKAVYLGLINSIIAGSDGKTTGTAFVVISTEEEYSAMRALGYSVSSQALVREGDHTFDVLSGTDQKTNSPVKIYFNIDIVWAAETKMFNPKS